MIALCPSQMRFNCYFFWLFAQLMET